MDGRVHRQDSNIIADRTFTHDKVEFTDGRHRFAWLRDHGLQALPVDVGAESDISFRARFETHLRAGRLYLEQA